MKEKLRIQKQLLKLALDFANMIEDADKNIEAGRHINFYKSIRTDAISQYADVITQIIETSINILENKSLSDSLFETIGTITKQYAIQKGINLK